MQKLLITGGSGFIARYFVKQLPSVSKVNLDLLTPDYQSDVEYFQGDIRKKEDVEIAIKGCDTVIHLAAMHHDFGISDEAYFDVNVNGAQILIESAEKHGIKNIIFFSSVAVYGNQGLEKPTTEETAPSPTSPYGKSKLAAEKLLERWAIKGRKLIIVRSTVVFGAHNLANVLNLIKVIDKGYYFHIGIGDNIKSLAYVENIVDATLFALKYSTEAVFLFNYVDEPQLTSRSIANMQTKMLGKSIKFGLPLSLTVFFAKPFDWFISLSGKNLPISSGRIKKLCTQTWHSAEKIRQLGFQPKHTIEYGMQQMIDWYKQQKAASK